MSTMLNAMIDAMITVYRLLGFTYFIERTERYIDARPVDALLLGWLTRVNCLILPLLVANWLCDVISGLTFLISSLVVFFSPPVITTIVIEFLLWKHRRRL